MGYFERKHLEGSKEVSNGKCFLDSRIMASLHPYFHCSIMSKQATSHIENQIILKL